MIPAGSGPRQTCGWEALNRGITWILRYPHSQGIDRVQSREAVVVAIAYISGGRRRDNYAAGGGCLSTRGKAGSIQAQRGALDVQMVIAGLARFGSSNVPTRTKIKCGRASASLKSAVPQ